MYEGRLTYKIYQSLSGPCLGLSASQNLGCNIALSEIFGRGASVMPMLGTLHTSKSCSLCQLLVPCSPACHVHVPNPEIILLLQKDFFFCFGIIIIILIWIMTIFFLKLLISSFLIFCCVSLACCRWFQAFVFPNTFSSLRCSPTLLPGDSFRF